MTKQPSQKDLDRQEIVIYQSGDGKASVDIKLMYDTLWLSINQIADLFEKDKSVIAKHLRKIFKDAELSKDSTMANFATVQTFSDGNKRIGCLLFLMYLKKSGLSLRLIKNNTLIALALLMAESSPSQKDVMIQLIMYLLHE